MVRNLREIIQKQVGIRELRALVPDYCRVVLYSSLLNDTRHRSLLFGHKTCVIVLYEGEIDDRQQSHFIVLSKRSNRIEYFSSMGYTAHHELSILNLKGKKPAFERLLGKAYEVNRKRFQQDKYTVNDCAWWCLARVMLYKLSLKEFQKFYSSKPTIQNTDDLLALTMFLIANQ